VVWEDGRPNNERPYPILNNVEVKRAKLKDYDGGFDFDLPLETVARSPLHPNLLQLETRVENFNLSKPNGLTFYSIDILP
jgi:hypothetical protein